MRESIRHKAETFSDRFALDFYGLAKNLTVVTFAVCLSEKLGKIPGCRQIQHNFKSTEYLCKLCKELETFVMSHALVRYH